ASASGAYLSGSAQFGTPTSTASSRRDRAMDMVGLNGLRAFRASGASPSPFIYHRGRVPRESNTFGGGGDASVDCRDASCGEGGIPFGPGGARHGFEEGGVLV